jgi:hypothetical protein
MRDLELGKIADHAHDNPILQSEAQKELYARHQEDLRRQEERQRELETDIQDLDVPPNTEPPAPAPSVEEQNFIREQQNSLFSKTSLEERIENAIRETGNTVNMAFAKILAVELANYIQDHEVTVKQIVSNIDGNNAQGCPLCGKFIDAFAGCSQNDCDGSKVMAFAEFCYELRYGETRYGSESDLIEK